MAEVKEATVLVEAKAEDTPNEQNEGGDRTKEAEETKAAEEEAANEAEATKAEGDGGTFCPKKRQNDLPARESKRARKSAESFEPANFHDMKEKVTIVQGRGSQLGAIPNVKESIESYSNTSDDLAMAHKLLFPIRGKAGKDDAKLRKDQLLAFSGYLTPLVEGEDKDERADIDEKAETKMSIKAYKLNIPALKRICDVFDVDRRKKTTKDELVDCLLDFLGAPDVKLTNAKKTDSKPEAKSPKQSKKEQDSEDESEEKDSEDEGEAKDSEKQEGNKMPSDKALQKWVHAYTMCFNLEKVTTRHALETASEKFGVDLTSKKARIKDLLTKESDKDV